MTHPRIPADVADAFGEALVLLVQWPGGADEPVATFDGKTMPIGKTFELVAGRAFRDEVPGSMLELLQTYAGRDPERQKEIAALALVPTCETAARCLLTWVGYKKSRWSGNKSAADQSLPTRYSAENFAYLPARSSIGLAGSCYVAAPTFQEGAGLMTPWWLTFRGGSAVIVEGNSVTHARVLAVANELGRASQFCRRFFA